MQSFLETVSVVSAIVIPIVAGIVVLSLYFSAARRMAGGGAKPETISVRGVLGKDTVAAVHMVGGQVFERVRFVGSISSHDVKTRLPYELHGMVVLEDEQRQRFIVRARDIKMIVVPPEHDKGQTTEA